MMFLEPIFQTLKPDARALLTGTLAAAAAPLRAETPSAVYVAYLDDNNDIITAYPIQLMPGSTPFATALNDATHNLPFTNMLIGPPAELLHIAITGRTLGQSPAQASTRRAKKARDLLIHKAPAPGFTEALVAVTRWGPTIQPWYGTVALDDSGRPLLHEPEYDDHLPLGQLHVIE